MFFFPAGTDAPAYYNPITTIGLIVVNVLAYWLSIYVWLEGGWEESMFFMLQFDTINPLQWITSHFMHSPNPMHLVGNMFFLWVFGIVIEGKIGWWKFLLLYLTIGLIDGAMVQIPMFLFAVGEAREIPAMGASGIIFGLMGISVMWAPANVVNVVYVVYFRFRAHWGVFDVPVLGFGGFYFALQVLFAFLGTYFGGFHMSSEILHLSGLVAGLPFGLGILWLGLVDCEGYDLFSHYFGMKPPRQSAHDSSDPIDQSSAQKRQLTQTISEALAEGHHTVAAKMYQKYSAELGRGSGFEFDDLSKLIQALQQQYLFRDAVPLMKEAISRLTSEEAIEWRLMLAQIEFERLSDPRAAQATLEKLSHQLSPDQRRRMGNLQSQIDQSLLI